MSNSTITSKPGRTLNIGIYGRTQAGKTRFLFQIFNHWERGRRLLAQSEEYQKFLSIVQAEIDQHGRPMPTAARFEGISVVVRLDNYTKPWKLVFRDLVGERLEEEIPLDGTIQREGQIASQVSECDAFLFFFDPVSSEKPSDIDNHHFRELKRAEMFVEYVLKHRQNAHLPIVFVLTHRDLYEYNPDILDKAEDWIEKIHAKLVELYDLHLRRYYPKSLADRSRTFFNVSSIGRTPQDDKQLEKVIEQLIDLHIDSIAHQNQMRTAGNYLLVIGVAFVTLFAAIIWWLFSSTAESPPTHKNDPLEIAEMSEQQINNTLNELDRWMKAHPRGNQLPTEKEAKQINHHLRWLTQRLELEKEGKTNLSERTWKRMQSALDSIAELVNSKAELQNYPPSMLVPILATYLEDLPDLQSIAPKVAQAQARYWQLQRSYVVEELARIIIRRGQVASPPFDTLTEIVNKLRDLEQEMVRSRVYGPQARNQLIEDIQTARTFCEDRKNTKTYSLKFRVAAAWLKTDGRVDDDLNNYWHCFQFESPGHSSYHYGLWPNRKGEYEVNFTTAQSSYQITLGLGTPLHCILYRYSIEGTGNGKWITLDQFNLATNPGPLAPLGLPLIEPYQKTVTILLQREDMELKLEFFDFLQVPPLLSEAATRSKERKS